MDVQTELVTLTTIGVQASYVRPAAAKATPPTMAKRNIFMSVSFG
jgi:hypothetical protein